MINGRKQRSRAAKVRPLPGSKVRLVRVWLYGPNGDVVQEGPLAFVPVLGESFIPITATSAFEARGVRFVDVSTGDARDSPFGGGAVMMMSTDVLNVSTCHGGVWSRGPVVEGVLLDRLARRLSEHRARAAQ